LAPGSYGSGVGILLKFTMCGGKHGFASPGRHYKQSFRATGDFVVPIMILNLPTVAGPELEEELERRIVQHTWGRIHQLQVERHGDQVVVRGYSPSYYIKQLALLAAQEMAQSVPVQFDIEVGKGEPRPSEGQNAR
jgi:hypothetical protein